MYIISVRGTEASKEIFGKVLQSKRLRGTIKQKK